MIPRTKIVATIGPASWSPEVIEQLIRSGMSVARLNFSHGSYDDHRQTIAAIRKSAERIGTSVAILQDLQGPKIRTGKLATSEPLKLQRGQQLRITTEDVPGTAECISTTYEALPLDVSPGDRILLSDGLIELLVEGVEGENVMTQVRNDGQLGANQGINLPGVKVSAQAISDKDYDDLLFGLEQGVDMVALSFVRTADDIRNIKNIISSRGKDTPVVAKIEKPEALEQIDAILEVVDGLMVARGDLGVEMPPEQVPLAQKRLIAAANAKAIPVITATQMLESMVNNPRPTRAEASDVANAILDGTDAVMLSGETAKGKYPVEAVSMMAGIAREVESSFDWRQLDTSRIDLKGIDTAPKAIGAAVDAIANSLPISSVWVYTQRGNTARLISSHRPRIPIMAFTPDAQVYRRLSLLRGVYPVLIGHVETLEELEERARKLALYQGVSAEGDTVLLTSSHPFDQNNESNFLKIISL